QVLKQTRSRKKFLFELILRKQRFMKFCQTKRFRETDLFEVDSHQPVEKQRSHEVKAAHHDQTKDELERISRQKSKMQRLANRACGNHVVQVDVLVEHHCVVIPSLSRPEPDPTWTTNKRPYHN